MRQLQYTGISVFILYLFHSLRNLTPVYFLLIGGALFIFFLLLIVCHQKVRLDKVTVFVTLCWVYASIVTGAESHIYGSPIVGLIRLWTAFPLILIFSVLSSSSVATPARLLTVFFLLAALSFPLQFLIGPIDWFAEPSERAGGVRYASLAGSLTAYGVLVGVPALAAIYYFRPLVGTLIFLLLAGGAILSLQKAAIANIIIVIIFLWWLKAIASRAPSFLAFALLIIGVFLALQEGYDSNQVSSALVHMKGVFSSDTELTNDVGFISSLIDRVTELPSTSITFFNQSSIFIGAGAFGGGGALGYPDLPMAHNGLIELLLVFGWLPGGIMIFLLIKHVWTSVTYLFNRQQVARTEVGFLSAAYIVWICNYIFSGGGLFQPVGAAIFWMIFLRLRAIHPYRNSFTIQPTAHK